MRRRQFLASLPGSLGLAGCISGPPSSDTTSSPAGSESPLSNEPPSDAPTASVTLRSALRYVYNDDAIGVDPPTGDQFAFVLPPEQGSDLPPDEFALELGDQRFVPRSSMPGFMFHTPGVGNAYTEDDRSGWLVFDVTTVDAETGALVRDETQYPIQADALPRFATAPDFSLQSVSVSETVSPGNSLSVTVDIANDGGRVGTFLAGIQRGGLFETVEVPVSAGKIGTTTVRLEQFADAGETEYFAFVYAGGRERYEVAIEDEA